MLWGPPTQNICTSLIATSEVGIAHVIGWINFLCLLICVSVTVKTDTCCNKPVVDITLRSPLCPLVCHFHHAPVAFASPIMGRCDVIHKTGST